MGNNAIAKVSTFTPQNLQCIYAGYNNNNELYVLLYFFKKIEAYITAVSVTRMRIFLVVFGVWSYDMLYSWINIK